MICNKYTINDICDVVTDYVANGSFKSLADNVNYLNEKSFARLIRLVDYNSNYREDNAIWVDEDSYNFLKKSELHGDEIIVSNVGANLGTVFLCPKLNTPMTLGPNSILLKTDENICNQDYLYYYLKSYDGHNKLMSIVSGSAMPKFNKTDLKKIEIDLPSIDVQKKIVKILKSIDNKINLNLNISNDIQKLINEIFIKWFRNYDYPNNNPCFKDSELGNIPIDWSVGILTDLVDFSNGYGFNSKLMLDNEEPETFKVFKMASIKIGGGFNKDKTKSWYKKSDCKGLDNYIGKIGDILMCMTDMKASENPLLGHTALMDVDDQYVINQRVGLLRCKKNITSYPYVYTLSNMPDFIRDIRSRANSGVQVNLSTKGICSTKVLIPDNNTLRTFNSMGEKFYNQIFSINKENEILEQLRDNLIKKLLKDEINLDNIII